jgi:hypothetical protein
MARPEVEVGKDGLQIWKVSANILNMQSRTAENGWSTIFFSLDVGLRSHCKKIALLQNYTKGIGFGEFFG